MNHTVQPHHLTCAQADLPTRSLVPLTPQPSTATTHMTTSKSGKPLNPPPNAPSRLARHYRTASTRPALARVQYGILSLSTLPPPLTNSPPAAPAVGHAWGFYWDGARRQSWCATALPSCRPVAGGCLYGNPAEREYVGCVLESSLAAASSRRGGRHSPRTSATMSILWTDPLPAPLGPSHSAPTPPASSDEPTAPCHGRRRRRPGLCIGHSSLCLSLEHDAATRRGE